MYCEHCNQYVADGTAICPYCNTPLPQTAGRPTPQNDNFFNQGAQRTQYQQNAYQPQQPNYQYPQQPYAPNPYAQYSNYQSELSTAKTMAIVALITGIIGINIIAWIFGGIGLSKLGSIPDIPQFANEKKKTKSMCIWGIIIPFIWGLIAVLCYVLFFAVLAGTASYY